VVTATATTTLTTTITITTSAQIGLLRLRVELRAGCSVLVEAAGHIPYAARSVPAADGWAQVILVQTIAGPLAGDLTTIEVDVGEGAKLELTTNAATLAYQASEPARHELTARVREGARFAWLPGPLILSRDCDLVSSIDIDLGDRAAALTHELVSLGRHGEEPGSYRSRLRFESRGRPLLHDVVDLDAAGAARASMVGIGGHNAFASLALVGIDPPAAPGAGELDLSCPGRVLRALASDMASLKTEIEGVEAEYRSALAA
jgi:urease accessory protein